MTFRGQHTLSRILQRWILCEYYGYLHARLLDLVPGRTGEAYKTWLQARGDTFRKNVQGLL